jgi:hypothetical protein
MEHADEAIQQADQAAFELFTRLREELVKGAQNG